MRVLRVYADTSVFGGCHDDEFEVASAAFFARVAGGDLRLVVSALTAAELQVAPNRVRGVLDSIPGAAVEFHDITAEMEALRDAYLEAGVLGPSSDADALHVAAATVLEVDLIVSWNFKHIVQYARIRGFNAVNLTHGYKIMEIYSPREVIDE